MNLLRRLRTAFAAAAPSGADPAAFGDAVRVSQSAKFGDYQANGCMSVAKSLGTGITPRALAEEVASRVVLAPMADRPEIAGAGFLNIKLRDEWIGRQLEILAHDPALGIVPAHEPFTVVIDFSSPNVAKPMHVGHLRSTIIGDSLARIHRALGRRVIRDNHLGDWGTQFGMILWGWKHHRDINAYEEDPVRELSRLYRLAQAKTLHEHWTKLQALENAGTAESQAEAQKLWNTSLAPLRISRDTIAAIAADKDAIAESARQETARLHAGDPERRALWSQFMPHCLAALEAVYKRLDITFDTRHGESFYDPFLADTVSDLEAKGLAVPSEGATAIFVDGSAAPMLIRKTDGAYTYATTDLATIAFRAKTYQPNLCLYVVDHRQSEHFKQLFDVAKRWRNDDMQLEHVAFGTIMGADRKPYKTRDGDVIGLESLLDEAVSEARKVVDENSPELDEATRIAVAEVVGLGAVKYADLSQNRMSDYIFDWKKMMAMNGNTATYLQYAYARTRSIFRKANLTPDEVIAKNPQVIVTHPAERALGVQLFRISEVLEQAAQDEKPNILTDYLFELANRFSSFFEECPVIKAESPERKDSRLVLCELTGRTLRLGLSLLGIQTAERM